MSEAGPSTGSKTARRAVAGLALLGGAVAAGFAFGLFDDSGPSPSGRAARPAAVEAGRAQAPAEATGSYRGAVPILMYHVIKAPAAGVSYPELWTPPEVFRRTVELLDRSGYRGVTLAQVWKAWHGGPGLPAKPVVVSFDDGYLSHFVSARPILRSVGWPGVLNLEGKNIGKGGLTVSQVRQLLASGWELGAHSLTHPDLPTVGDADLEREVAGSRRLLRRTFGVPVESFCYPAGRNDARVREAVRRAGFSNATTVEPGIAAPGDDPFALPRIRVNGTDSAEVVLDRVRSGSGASGGYG